MEVLQIAGFEGDVLFFYPIYRETRTGPPQPNEFNFN